MHPDDPQQAMTRQLDPGEKLLWSGEPRQGLVLRAADAFLIPFSLLWCGFAVFWETMAIASGAPFLFALWGVPFVLMGLHVVVGRFFVDARVRARTSYALTDRRVIIVSGLFTPTIRTLALRTLGEITLEEKSDGTGTITFGPTHPAARHMRGLAWPGASQFQSPAFDMIRSVASVHRLVRDAQKSA